MFAWACRWLLVTLLALLRAPVAAAKALHGRAKRPKPAVRSSAVLGTLLALFVALSAASDVPSFGARQGDMRTLVDEVDPKQNAVTSTNTIALLHAPGRRPVQDTVYWVHSDWKATTAKQFATNCSWTPLQRLPADKSVPAIWYDFLSDLYERAIEMGHQYSIVDGGLLCLYREGRICPHDSDLDFYFRDALGMKEVFDFLTDMPKYKQFRGHDHACCAATNVGVPMRDQMGAGCTCYLPDGRKTGCAEDVAGYASWHYGPAWWLPLHMGKASIVTGHERREEFVAPYARSIAKELDKNGNGWIEAAEVQQQAKQMHIAPAHLNQAIQHLNFVLQLSRDGCDDGARCSHCAVLHGGLQHVQPCDVNCDNHRYMHAYSPFCVVEYLGNLFLL